MKYYKTDKKYLNDRQKFSQIGVSDNLWEFIDHWPLYVGISNLARFLSIYEIFKSSLNIPGHIAEFGCWKGANLVFMAKLLKILDPNGYKLVYGFDSFEGLTNFHLEDAKALKNRNYYKGNKNSLASLIKLYSLEDDIVIKKGLIEEVLPVFLKDSSCSFSLVYIDTDLYSSTKIILETLHNRLSLGGFFVFDEWNYSNYPGETVAVREFLSSNGNNYEMINTNNTRQPSLLLKKIKNGE